MRLLTPRAALHRTWTVELQPRPEGPALACPQCTPLPRPLPAGTARATALAHLARHARERTLPAHLRTCQCQARGCRWHPRHRGCAGSVQLVLTRDRSGRRWCLADACAACAAATEQAAVVPDTLPIDSPSPPEHSPMRSGACRLPELGRVREMLTYLGAALPHFCSPTARLLALQCALRANRCGQVHLSGGLLRGMRLAGHATPWQELTHADWLSCASPSPVQPAVVSWRNCWTPLSWRRYPVARGGRAPPTGPCTPPPPGHRAQRTTRPPAGRLGARLSHHEHLRRGRDRSPHRVCGLSTSHMEDLLDHLRRLRLRTAWGYDVDSDELCWQLPTAARHCA